MVYVFFFNISLLLLLHFNVFIHILWCFDCNYLSIYLSMYVLSIYLSEVGGAWTRHGWYQAEVANLILKLIEVDQKLNVLFIRRKNLSTVIDIFYLYHTHSGKKYLICAVYLFQLSNCSALLLTCLRLMDLLFPLLLKSYDLKTEVHTELWLWCTAYTPSLKPC